MIYLFAATVSATRLVGDNDLREIAFSTIVFTFDDSEGTDTVEGSVDSEARKRFPAGEGWEEWKHHLFEIPNGLCFSAVTRPDEEMILQWSIERRSIEVSK